MSRGDNWIKIDKNSSQEFKFINRPFSRIEALVSMTIDIDNGKEWSVSGYAKLWQWSRNKVRKFTSELRTDSGHSLDRCRTHFGHPIHLIVKTLPPTKDRLGTDSGQTMDGLRDTTSKTKTETKKEKTTGKKKVFVIPSTEAVKEYCTERDNNIDPETFIDHYGSVGWVIGKDKPMKCWKSAVRNWEKRQKSNGRGSQSTSSGYTDPTPEKNYREGL